MSSLTKKGPKGNLTINKYKVLIKHAKASKKRINQKIYQDLKTQNKSYETNQELLELRLAQEKMDKLVKKAKINSKSMQKLINKADVKDQVITKKHLQEGEGEGEEY